MKASIQRKTRASGLGWTPAGLPHTQGVHRNLRTNPVDPSGPLQKLTHTVTLIVSCILHSTDVWFCPPQCGLYSVRAQNKAERRSPVDPGISRGATDLYPSRWYTPRNTRDRGITRSLQNRILIKNPFWSFSSSSSHTAQVYFFIYFNIFKGQYTCKNERPVYHAACKDVHRP